MPRRLLASLAVLASVVPLFLGSISADETSTPQQPIRSNPPRVYALTGAKFVVSAGQMLDEATIVVRDGGIEAVDAGIPVPADAREISLKGKTVYPGFVEAYSEQSIPEISLRFAASRVTGRQSRRRQDLPVSTVTPDLANTATRFVLPTKLELARYYPP